VTLPVVVRLSSRSTVTVVLASRRLRLRWRRGPTRPFVHVDDFYRDMAERERLELTAVQGVDRYFDWERPPSGGHRAPRPTDASRLWLLRLGCRPWSDETHHHRASRCRSRRGRVLRSPGVRRSSDVKVLVDLPGATRTERRQQRARTVSRNDPQAWDDRWHAAERHHFHAVRPRETFDLIVRGDS
jgi:hypothetical protein